MIFSSVVFLFYFLPTVLVLYYVFQFNVKIKNFILLVFSLFFYAWGEPRFILILLISIVSNYIFAILVDNRRVSKGYCKFLLFCMAVTNLSFLFIFKYLMFTVENINQLLDTSIVIPTLVLPIGISFFTFQAMSYVIDVYREDGKLQRNIFNLALYISFFPQLIAGPIVRYETVAEQIEHRQETINKFSIGCCRFIVGLAKKLIIANNMAIVADQIYAMNALGGIPTTLAWLGSIAYMLQIFFDFSAYSDMAIGLGLMFGFKFEENFNYPYVAKSLTEFWRRWHISLGSWFRSYVYIPLGGSRVKNKDIMVRNLFIVWMLTGIWHGAAWTFVIWGFVNFVVIVFEKITGFENMKIASPIKHMYALLVINLAWVLFRSETLTNATYYFKSLFSAEYGLTSDYTIMFLREYGIFFVIAIVLSTPIARKMNRFVANQARGYSLYHLTYPIAMSILFIVCVSYLLVGTYNPFIYFNF